MIFAIRSSFVVGLGLGFEVTGLTVTGAGVTGRMPFSIKFS